MKRERERERERWRKDDFFFKKNVSGPSNPPDELAQNVSKKNPFRTNYSSIFSAKVQNLAVFSFIYMIRIRFFGPQELIQKYFRRARYVGQGKCRGSNIVVQEHILERRVWRRIAEQIVDTPALPPGQGSTAGS